MSAEWACTLVYGVKEQTSLPTRAAIAWAAKNCREALVARGFSVILSERIDELDRAVYTGVMPR